MATSSTYSDIVTDGPTAFSIPLMATENSVTLSMDPCGTPLSCGYAQIKHCQDGQGNIDPGGSSKGTMVVDS
jgi:hypothetical protein